jgi:hypothetical protein
MIIKRITQNHDLSEYARWFLITGQICLWVGFLLSRSDVLAITLLSGILIGISIVAHITYLRIMPRNKK